MIPWWDHHLAFTGLWLICYLLVAYFSLLYYKDRNQIEQNKLKIFFNSLSSPVRFGLTLPIWILRDKHPLDGKSKYGKSWIDFLFMKTVFTLATINPSIIYARDLVNANTKAEVISAGIGLILAMYLFVRSWIFGYKLKYIQAAAPNEEAYTS